jgi:hypothetical protein
MRIVVPAALACMMLASPALAQDYSPPVGGPFYNTGGNENGYSFAAAGTIKREGSTATMTRVTMLAKVRTIEGLEVARLDTVMEYECEKVAMRPTLIGARGLDNGLLKVIPRPDQPWQDITAEDPNSAFELELACNGIAPEGRPVFNDIDARIRRYRETGQ